MRQWISKPINIVMAICGTCIAIAMPLFALGFNQTALIFLSIVGIVAGLPVFGLFSLLVYETLKKVISRKDE